MRRISYAEILTAASNLADWLVEKLPSCTTMKAYPIPRGGVPAGLVLQSQLLARGVKLLLTEVPEDASIVLDDLIDSGATMARFPYHLRAALFTKRHPEPLAYGTPLPAQEWVQFPWEAEESQGGDDIVRRLLQFIGEDPHRGGLLETPARVLKAWRHWTSGYDKDPAAILKTFEDGAESVDELVLVRDIPVYSQCEHHLAPFFGVAHVGYIPDGKIVGLSKLSRLVDMFARRLQVQERLTNQIADAIEEHLRPLGVGVVLECRHLCMESRGIQQQGHRTITSAMRGALRDSDAARAEFMGMIR